MIERTWKRLIVDMNGPFVDMNNGYPYCSMSYMNGEKCWIIIPCFSIGSDGKALSPRHSKPGDACEIRPEWSQWYKDCMENAMDDDALFCYEIRFGKCIGIVGHKYELTLETIDNQKKEMEEWKRKKGLK